MEKEQMLIRYREQIRGLQVDKMSEASQKVEIFGYKINVIGYNIQQW